jgi:hypothetical protein
MDFDAMPDSYFAFLSNQRKLVEPEKINGAMRDLGRGSEPAADGSVRNKVRSRASQPNLSHGSKPSVPSLPMQRGSVPSGGPNGRGYPVTAATPPSRPQLGNKPPTGPGGTRPPMGDFNSRGGYPVAPMARHASGGHSHPMGAAAMNGQPGIGPNGQPAPHMMNGHPGMSGQMPSQMPPGMSGQMPVHPGQMPPMQGQVPHSGPMLPMHPSHPSMTHGHSSPQLTNPNMSREAYFGAQGMPAPVTAPRGNAIVYVLIAVLVVAIGVLAYLVVTK